MVAQVAALDPETAAKIAQPATLTCSSRPGRRCIHGARPRNMSSDSRVRNRISPIQMNSGSAVSVQLDAEPQIVTAIASPAGRVLNSCMPIHATPESVSPIHTPLPRMRNSDATSSAVTAKSFIAGGLVRAHDDASTADFEHELVDEGDREHERPERHRELRDPQRRRVAGGGDVVEGV